MNAVEQSYFNALICQIKESGFDSHRHRNPIGSWFLGTFLQLKIKKNVVESDERESGIRKILNFGHTLGHAIEAEEEMRGFYHGECVALGMLPVISSALKSRLTGVWFRKKGEILRFKGFLQKHKILWIFLHKNRLYGKI